MTGKPVEAGGTGHAWRVRPATDDDSWELVALIGACWSEYPGCIMDVHGECPDLLAPATAYRSMGGTMWVVDEPGGALIGSVAYRRLGPDRIELERLYVAKRRRQLGLARHLVGLVEDQGRATTHTPKTTITATAPMTVELWSDTRFSDAHRLYDRLGYRASGRLRELHDLSHTVEQHFTKALPPP